MTNAARISLLVSAITAAQTPAFDVASIRPAVDQRRIAAELFFCPFGCFNEGRLKIVGSGAGSRVDIAYMPLDQIVIRAYRIRPDQLSGPDWLPQQRFDILANIPDNATAAQVPEMLQALLSERFKLAVHRETRDHPVYALIVDKNGPKLKESTEPPPAEGRSDSTLNSPKGPIQSRRIDNGMLVTKGPWGPMRMIRTASGENAPDMELLAVTMPMLADALTQFMDHPVIDKTGLTGTYQFALWQQDIEPFLSERFTRLKGNGPVPRDGPGTASDPTGSSTIFKTMEKQGLKLERTRLPVEILVIDHLEKTPTEN